MSPERISFDGKWIGGYAFDDAGETVLSVYEIATERFDLPRREDGRPFRVWGDVAWLDNDRLVFWDTELSRPVVWDVGKRVLRLLDGIPGPSEFGFTADGRTMAINHTAEESDIWLLTLAE